MNTEGSFPVKPIRTDQNWHSLLIDGSTQTQVDELKKWLQTQGTTRSSVLPDGSMQQTTGGLKVLFAGSPARGKAVAALLAKEAGKEVFHISLSKVVSKYVGETEKNLDNLFDNATRKNWILFFDEADALFNKHSDIKDAGDRYASPEGNYLLNKIERYNGLVILASSREQHLNDQVITRLDSVVHFG